MKKLNIIFLLVALCLATGCKEQEEAGTIIEQPQAQVQETTVTEVSQENSTQEANESIQNDTTVTITSEDIKGKSDENLKDRVYEYEYNRLVIEIKDNEAAQKKIQDDLDQYIEKFLESLNEEEFGLIIEGYEPAMNSYQHLNMDVVRADDMVVSIAMNQEGYNGGAHGWHSCVCYNYFTQTGDRITFDQLGEEFREKAERLVLYKANERQSEEQIFFEDYIKSIPLVVLDGTEDMKEVLGRVYGDEDWLDEYAGEHYEPSYYITDTGFGFISDEYVLQPYAAGSVEFEFTAADFGDSLQADIFDSEEAFKTTVDESGVAGIRNPITAQEYAIYEKSIAPEDAKGFDDFQELLTKDYIGTWYDPNFGDALRLTSIGAYVYIPYLDMYGDTLYDWELVDRSGEGKCPMLAIYYAGRDSAPLAYYVGGYREGYFWCNAQGQVFVKVED